MSKWMIVFYKSYKYTAQETNELKSDFTAKLH